MVNRGELVFEVFEEVQKLADNDLRIGQIMKIVESKLKEEDEISPIYTPAEEKIEILCDAYIKLSMELMNEGWEYSEDEDFNGMNLLPVMQKIKTLKMLQAIADPNIMEANMDGMGRPYV